MFDWLRSSKVEEPKKDVQEDDEKEWDGKWDILHGKHPECKERGELVCVIKIYDTATNVQFPPNAYRKEGKVYCKDIVAGYCARDYYKKIEREVYLMKGDQFELWDKLFNEYSSRLGFVKEPAIKALEEVLKLKPDCQKQDK